MSKVICFWKHEEDEKVVGGWDEHCFSYHGQGRPLWGGVIWAEARMQKRNHGKI